MTFYFFKNKIIVLAIQVIDQCLSLFVKKKPYTNPSFQKILLSNFAHLGDLIMATAVLPVLKAAFPNAKIGMVVGSWNEEVVRGHPLIDEWYVFDHMKLNRRDKGVFRKLLAHYSSRRKTLKKLRHEKYDVALDLYYYFPNAAVLFWQASIPWRLGFSSGGFGPLLTHSFPYEEKDLYLAHYYLPLLQGMGVSQEALSLLHTTLWPVPPFLDGPYVVIHMGVGEAKREWGDLYWEALVALLEQHEINLVFTGRGEKEKERVTRIAWGAHQDLCNSLNFIELLACVQGALLTISPDTGIVHLAGALKVRSLVLFSREVNPYQRIQDQALTVAMTLTNTPQEVYEKVRNMLNLSK